MTRPIVELCEHGEAKKHYIALPPSRDPADIGWCPGGRVLEQAIIIERDTHRTWPAWAIRALDTLAPEWAVSALDALASAQEARPIWMSDDAAEWEPEL